jgi:hypothetical protein
MVLDSNAIPINSMQSISPMGVSLADHLLNVESRRESTLETNVSCGQMSPSCPITANVLLEAQSFSSIRDA